MDCSFDTFTELIYDIDLLHNQQWHVNLTFKASTQLYNKVYNIHTTQFHMKGCATVLTIHAGFSCSAAKVCLCASVSIKSYLKKVWCSMQTFHNRFEARWLGSLKPMVLSNCSYWEVRGERWWWRKRKGMWRRRGEWREWVVGRDGGVVASANCVYSAVMEKSMLFFLFTCTRNIISHLPCQVNFPSLTNLQISCSCTRSIRCSVV